MVKKYNSDFYINHQKEMQIKKSKKFSSILDHKLFFLFSLCIGALFYPLGIALCLFYYEHQMKKKAMIIGFASSLGFIISIILAILYLDDYYNNFPWY